MSQSQPQNHSQGHSQGQPLSHPFESFVKNVYPRHHRRILVAQAGTRWPLLKGVFSTLVIFGAPLSAVFWGLGLFLDAQAHRLQDGQKPLPFVQYVEPATVALICLTLIVCVMVGALLGYLKECQLKLQIERDQLSLRADFLLREVLDRQVQTFGQASEESFVLRSPSPDSSGEEEVEHGSLKGHVPESSGVDSADEGRDEPAVALHGLTQPSQAPGSRKSF